MTATATRNQPVPFSSEDYANRMSRAADEARGAGLDGLVVTPGPDLVWLTGYQPTAITERLTMLVLTPGARPRLLVPALERADAEAAEGAASLEVLDWSDGADPYAAARDMVGGEGDFGISDSAWAMHVLGLQQALPRTLGVIVRSRRGPRGR